MAILSRTQIELLSQIHRMTFWGGFYTHNYSKWRAIKRLQARRLVKRVDRCKRWHDQFWCVTDAGISALSSTQEKSP